MWQKNVKGFLKSVGAYQCSLIARYITLRSSWTNIAFSVSNENTTSPISFGIGVRIYPFNGPQRKRSCLLKLFPTITRERIALESQGIVTFEKFEKNANFW